MQSLNLSTGCVPMHAELAGLTEGKRMQANLDFDRDQLSTASAWARQQTDQWGVPPSHVAHWIATAAALLPAQALGRIELSYDEAMGLLSLDVYSGEGRVYGMDDWVS